MISSKTKCSFAKTANVALNLPLLKNTNFSLFTYPRCIHCNHTMQIYKIRRYFVRFRCRKCNFKTSVPLSLPQPVTFTIQPFKFFRFPIYIVLKAFILYFKYNLSLRAIKASLNINVSHVAIYKWIIKLSSIVLLFKFENVFKIHGDETVIVFQNRKYYV